MTALFQDRERAAEYGFAHGEERHFLAVRHGVEALGAWAADKIGVEPAPYAASLVGDFLQGATAAALLARVDGDFRRGNIAVEAGAAGAVLDRSTAAAEAELRGVATASASRLRSAAAYAAFEHRPHGFWGWDI